MGSATAVVVATLLAIYALDNPYQSESGASSRSRWNARSSSSRRLARILRARPRPCPATREEPLDDRPRRGRLRRCCWRSRQWRRRGAATRRRAGTASRPRPRARTNAIRIEAARAQGLAQAQTQVDVATFTQWVDAYARKETELADFYFERFRAEFKPAVDAWIAARPLKNPERAADPVRDAAVPAGRHADAERLDAEAEVSAARSSGATSSGHRTTCSASCSLRSRSSSPG